MCRETTIINKKTWVKQRATSLRRSEQRLLQQRDSKLMGWKASRSVVSWSHSTAITASSPPFQAKHLVGKSVSLRYGLDTERVTLAPPSISLMCEVALPILRPIIKVVAGGIRPRTTLSSAASKQKERIGSRWHQTATANRVVNLPAWLTWTF